MKKSLLAALVVMFVMTVSAISSCKNDTAAAADRMLTESVAKYNNSGNHDYNITYSNHVLAYRYKLPTDTLMRVNVDALRQKALKALHSPGSQKLVTKAIDAQADIQYVYYDDNDSIVFTFTPADLKK